MAVLYGKRSPDRVEASFMKRVNKTESCWVWVGLLNPQGYGTYTPTHSGGSWLAHRWSYTHFVGQIPEGLHVHHECVNPKCVNPAHLRAVTAKENAFASMSATRRRAEKTHCLHGHEYSPENTWRDYKGRRYCRKCHLLHQKARYRAGLVVDKRRAKPKETARLLYEGWTPDAR
jgi:hypothetical protein